MGNALSVQAANAINDEEDGGSAALALTQTLLQQLKDVSEPYDDQDNTLLHVAASRGHPRTLTLLCDRGANVNAANKRGATPLHNAVFVGSHEKVNLLLQRGADVNAADADGMAALQWAVVQRHAHVAELLVGAGADLAHQTASGDTALLMAARVRPAQAAEQMRAALTAAAQRRSTRSSARHAALCALWRVYGTVMHVHPQMPLRTEREGGSVLGDVWERACAAAVADVLAADADVLPHTQAGDGGALVAVSKHSEHVQRQFVRTVVSGLVNALGDAQTYVDDGAGRTGGRDGPDVAALAAAALAEGQQPQTPHVAPHPQLQFTKDGIAVIVMTEQAALGDYCLMPVFYDRFEQAREKSKAVVLDVRAPRGTPALSASGEYTFTYMLTEALRGLVAEPLRLPARRGRLAVGLTEQSHGGSSGHFVGGFVTQDGRVVLPHGSKRDAAAAGGGGISTGNNSGGGGGASLVFVVNSGTPSTVVDLAVGAQTSGQALIVYEQETRGHVVLKRDPHVRVSLPDPSSGGHALLPGVSVVVPVSMRVCADESCGFVPDVAVPRSTHAPASAGNASGGGGGGGVLNSDDAALRAAFSALRLPTSVPPRAKQTVTLYTQQHTPAYHGAADDRRGAAPALAWRHVALFRALAAINYYFAYGDDDGALCERLLYDALPRLSAAESALTYAKLFVRLLSELGDPTCSVRCRALTAALGTHTPHGVQLQLLEGGAVVIAAVQPASQHLLGVGDVVVRVGEQTTAERLRDVGECIVCGSGDEWMQRRAGVADWLLAGAPDSPCVLTVRRGTGSGNDTAVQVEVPRDAPVRANTAAPAHGGTAVSRRQAPIGEITKGTVYVDPSRVTSGSLATAWLSVLRTASVVIVDLRHRGAAYGDQREACRLLLSLLAAAFRGRAAPTTVDDTDEGGAAAVPPIVTQGSFLPALLPQEDAFLARLAAPDSLCMASVERPRVLHVAKLPPGTTSAIQRVVALVDERTCDSVCLELRAAVGADRVALVGSRTSGFSSQTLMTNIAVPGNVMLYFPTGGVATADGDPLHGRGLQPDLAVLATPESVRSGRDICLDAAMQLK